jgi:hypothetical protein
MLHKKLLAILVAGTLASIAFVANADEYVHCTFNSGTGGFNFSKLSNAQEVNSDFGSTTRYMVDSDGHITWAQSNTPSCDRDDFECRIKNPGWQFYKGEDGKWTIQGTFPDNPWGKGINVYDAVCTSSPTNPHNNAPW